MIFWTIQELRHYHPSINTIQRYLAPSTPPATPAVKLTPVKLTPVKFAPVKFAPVKFAPVKAAPDWYDGDTQSEKLFSTTEQLPTENLPTEQLPTGQLTLSLFGSTSINFQHAVALPGWCCGS